MRPQCCTQGHELLWLTNYLAVCTECDEEEFIYHHPGLFERLVQFCHHKPLTGRVLTGDRKPQPLHILSVAGLLMKFQYRCFK